MTDEEYEKTSLSIARSIGVSDTQWTNSNYLDIAKHMPIEALKYVVETPKPKGGLWVHDWVKTCKNELMDRAADDIILES
jgi:hypothetical protein